MNKVPVRCQAFSIHYLFESSLQVVKIYILPSFTKWQNWVSGSLIESDLVHHLWATQQINTEASGVPGDTL